MWTYLLIFISIATVLGVYIRRLYLYVKKKDQVEEVRAEVKEEEKVFKPRKIDAEIQAEIQELCEKGERMVKVGKDDEAIKFFVQALALDEYHQETQHKLAMLYLKKQMYGAAAALFKQLGQVTKDPVHYSHLGFVLYQQSNYPEALEAYQKAVDLDDSRAQRFISLAQVYRAMGRLHNCMIALNKAIELEQENIEHLFLLADVQVELGNMAEAEEIVQNILKLAPENEDAKSFLKEIKKLKVERA